MKSLFFAAVGTVALTLFAGPATAAQPPNMQERAVISEEIGLSVDWDVSAGAGAFEAVVTDASTGEEVADISKFVSSEDVIVSTDGTVTVDAQNASTSNNAQAAQCSKTVTIRGKYGNITNRACRSGNSVKVSGSVKDTKADSYCVKAGAKFAKTTWTTPRRACPKGNVKSFDSGYKSGTRVSMYEIGQRV